jgi:hypothetical protein
MRFRVFCYKATTSSRDRPHERRVEITTTYLKGNLRRASGYRDVVFGYDVVAQRLIGIDPRRLSHGGPSGNASTFIDADLLDLATTESIYVAPRKCDVFESGLEYQAYLLPDRVLEYLANIDAIHAGNYSGAGLYSGEIRQVRPVVDPRDFPDSGTTLMLTLATRQPQQPPPPRLPVTDDPDVEPESPARRRRSMTPSQLKAMLKRKEEMGFLGEEFAIQYERRRLRRLGRADLAARIVWISQRNVSEGYDIRSFEADGTERCIEVKSTVGTSTSFQMSLGEMDVATQLSDRYYIYRVYSVIQSPALTEFKNPHDLLARGILIRSASGWVISQQTTAG